MSSQVIHLGAKKRAAGLLLGLGATVLRGFAAVARANPRSSRPPVLILEPFGMGDVISLQPLVSALQRDGFDVRMCAQSQWRELYPSVEQWIPCRVPWSTYADQAKYSLGQYMSAPFRAFLRQLRSVAQDAIGFDTRGDIRSVMLLYLAGCRRVLTLSNYLGTDLNNFAGAAERVPFNPNLHRWKLNLLFLDRLRVKNAGGGPGFPHLARRETTVRERQLGLIPIAPWAGKHWGPANWSQFIPLARAEGWQVTALCGPGQSEAAIRELGTGVELVESKSIRHWADTLQTCSALVTVDTGPMHLADALGIPLVALFGQGLLPLWAPSAPTSRILHHQFDSDFILCHPIQKNTLYAQRFMARIHPADVLKALEDFTSTGDS